MAGREDATQKSYRRRSVSESDQDLFNMAGHKDAPQRFYRRRLVSVSDQDLFDTAGHKDVPLRFYRRRSVSESNQDLFNRGGHEEVPQNSHRRWSVSESNHDVFDYPPAPLGSSPIPGVPNYSDSRFNSQPNNIGSELTDESPWSGLGTRLRGEIRGGQDERVGKIKKPIRDIENRYCRLEQECTKWGTYVTWDNWKTYCVMYHH